MGYPRREDVTNEWLREVYARYLAGESLHDLAAEVKWTRQCLYDYLRNRGIHKPIKGAYGLQGMTPEKRRRVQSSGGKATRAGGKYYRFTEAELRRNGKKGGHMAWVNKKAHRWTSEEARAASLKARANYRRKKEKESGVPPPEPGIE